MKYTLMIAASVATLVAAGGLASAQGMKEQPAAAAPEQKAPQKSEAVKPGPAAQAPEGKADHNSTAPKKSEAVKPGPAAQAPEAKPDHKSTAPQKTEAVKPARTGEAAEKPGAKSDTTGQGSGAQPSPHNAQTPGAPNAAANTEPKTGAPAALSTEHHAQFRETIRSEKVERLTDVHFRISVGEAIPRTVHLHRLPTRVIEYAPQYRDYEYILVGDDILIIDPHTHMIVAVISA